MLDSVAVVVHPEYPIVGAGSRLVLQLAVVATSADNLTAGKGVKSCWWGRQPGIPTVAPSERRHSLGIQHLKFSAG